MHGDLWRDGSSLIVQSGRRRTEMCQIIRHKNQIQTANNTLSNVETSRRGSARRRERKRSTILFSRCFESLSLKVLIAVYEMRLC